MLVLIPSSTILWERRLGFCWAELAQTPSCRRCGQLPSFIHFGKYISCMWISKIVLTSFQQGTTLGAFLFSRKASALLLGQAPGAEALLQSSAPAPFHLMALSSIEHLGITCVVMFLAAMGSGMLPLLIQVRPTAWTFDHFLILCMHASSDCDSYNL